MTSLETFSESRYRVRYDLLHDIIHAKNEKQAVPKFGIMRRIRKTEVTTIQPEGWKWK
jgi:hypothetical protein